MTASAAMQIFAGLALFTRTLTIHPHDSDTLVLDQNDDIWRRLKSHLLLRVYLSYILIERSKWYLI